MPPQSKLEHDLPKLAKELAKTGPLKKVPTERRIRILFNGQYVADTTSALFVWEHEYYPQYYLPVDAFVSRFVKPGQDITDGDGSPVARFWTIEVDGRRADEVVEMLAGPLKGLVKVEFSAMDAWFEEDTPIQVHPKDPYKRIDIVHSTRHIRIIVGGKIVADTTSSQHLYETGLPTRYYMPRTAVDQSVLRPSQTRTKCPYKGEAEYYSVIVDGKEFKDVVWYYTNPKTEVSAVQGLVCFYNEKVDVEIDGRTQERRRSPWS